MGRGRFRGVVPAAYVILRLLVILVMIDQMNRCNYDNVYICLLTLVLFLLPAFVGRRLRVELPDTLEIVLLLFIFASEILGEIHECYLLLPFWDTILHAVNGFLFAGFGFSLTEAMTRGWSEKTLWAPGYLVLSGLCFSMTIGVLWEFLEWGLDLAFGLDMQKDTVVAGIQSVYLPHKLEGIADTVVIFSDGTAAHLELGGYLDVGLHDTMGDLLVNLIGAAVFSCIGYFHGKYRRMGRIVRLFIPRPAGREDEEQ